MNTYNLVNAEYAFDGLMEYITLCLDSTNKVETLVRLAKLIYCIIS